MTDTPELKVKIGAYSSVVGAGVHLHEQDGRFAGQIAIMCQTETLRHKALQQAMCEVIAKALEQFFAGKEAPLQPDPDARQADLAKAWQPIETAPKDGSYVDLWCRRPNGKAMRVTDMWWVESIGWRTDVRNPFDEDMAKSATHWMPLPTPPAELAAKIGGAE